MGKEVTEGLSGKNNGEEFHKRLREETSILKTWFDQKRFKHDTLKTGIELEAWLVNENMLPDPCNDEFLKKVNHSQVVPEIAKFNFEINSNPYAFEPNLFSALEAELNTMWNLCAEKAGLDSKNALLIGTLPTLRPHMLSTEYLSAQNRYSVMNAQVMKMRDGKPMYLRLEGRDQFYMYMDSVIAECAATSLQVHLGVSQHQAKRYYNASTIASPFLIALSANAPYFFGRELWDESRIAVFEQAVDLSARRNKDGKTIKRVTLGTGYIEESLFELFEENLEDYPLLLTELIDSEPKDLNHLRLHNGTIWRWTRPIIGDDSNGNYHLRIEQRTPSAGPTIVDSIANTAFFIGLVDYLASMKVAPESLISFNEAIDNFYKASRQSLYAKIMWVDGQLHCVRDLLINEIIPEVKKALSLRGICHHEISYYIDDVISPRVTKIVNGAIWQKAYIHKNGKRFQELLETYSQNQKDGKPIHQWRL